MLRCVVDGQGLKFEYAVLDGSGNRCVLASVVGPSEKIKEIKGNIKRNINITIHHSIKENGRRGSAYCSMNNVTMKSKKMPKSSISHAVFSLKDNITKEGELSFLILYRDEEDLNKKLYDKIYKNTAVPMKEEWAEYVKDRLFARNRIDRCTIHYGIENYSIGYKPCIVRTTKQEILAIIQEGLRLDRISFCENKEVSLVMNSVSGLDGYLNMFGDILAAKIQESFVPKFILDQDEFTQGVHNFDDSCFHGGKVMYKAQKMAVQATNNNLKENNTSFIIAEMGFGKSLISAGAVYSNYYDTTGNKAGLRCIVVCPGHILLKWKREIEDVVPNSVGYIISSFSDLKALEYKIKYSNPKENSFFIISRDAAKSSYEYRPSVNWSVHKNAFKCPCCGNALKKKVKSQYGRYYNYKPLTVEDMMKESAINKTCSSCEASLWGPVNKEEKNPKWIKLGKLGWLPIRHVKSLYDKYDSRENLTRKEAEFYSRLVDAKKAIDDKDYTRGLKAPRKYSMAKYIKDNFKFDYCIVDELQDYKGMSAQGQAMADIVRASKKTIAATGTLLNGFADGLFYILYRCFPKLMKKEGFSFEDEANFAREYGVIKQTNSFALGRNGAQTSLSSKEKRLPGVSPIVFTKFLLENAIFLSLSDLEGGLPAYTEIPIGIDMDNELSEAYETLAAEIRRGSRAFSRDGQKLIASLTQTLGCFPDCPYDFDNIVSDDGSTLIEVPDLNKDTIRNKEEKLVEIVEDKISKGEKVLIYCEWTEKTDTQDRLNKRLNDLGYNSFVLKSSKKNSEREAFIKSKVDKGANIMICNPRLVETGLDLLEFTTIVFYQTTYNLFTMRQASRRSWRLSQTNDVEIYFLYYRNTVQETTVGLMATKLQASMALEGNMGEEGLRALSNNEDMLSQIAKNVVEGIKDQVEVKSFAVERTERIYDTSRDRQPMSKLLVSQPINFRVNYLRRNTKKSNTKKNKVIHSYMNDISNVFNYNWLG